MLYLQEPAAKKAKQDEEEAPAVEYKTVPCKKYWTIGRCELGPKCVYIHQVRRYSSERSLPTLNPIQVACFLNRRWVMLWRSRSWPTMASCRHLSLSLSPSSQFQMWAPRIFAVFRVAGVLALHRALVALHLRSSQRVLAQNMTGWVELAKYSIQQSWNSG